MYLRLHYVKSKDNVLADSASRMQWTIFWDNFDTYHGFADYRAARLKQNAEQANDPTAILPKKIQMAIGNLKNKAYEASTIKGAESAWQPWCKYMMDCNRDPMLKPDDPNYQVYLTGFKAALAQGMYAELTTAGSVSTYYNQVISILNSKEISKIDRAVSRGMQKELACNKRIDEPFMISYMCSMYEHLDLTNLKKVRNLLAYSFLGFSIQRSQACTNKNSQPTGQTKQEEKFFTDRTLLTQDVELDTENWTVWWALKHSKGDPFGKRKGKDGNDWTATAGCRRPTHPIDIFRLTQVYCKLMGIKLNEKCNRKAQPFKNQAGRKPAAMIPFFQQLDANGRPTGKALTYAVLLKELRNDLADIADIYPELTDTAPLFGLHCFRRFGATLAKTNGVPDDITQYLGRWISDCFQRYFLFSDDDKIAMSRSMLGAA